ncbi:MAG TPA: hypothetical protein VMK32_07855 [Burkholderiaceae bacterium]|nr:hypothetical protein [Burkholderiaceae bacterium]
MNIRYAQISAGLFFASAMVAGANAEYRCAPAQTSIDRGACAAAEQGPDELRRYVQRWDKQMSSLLFADYVDQKTARAWEAKMAVTKESTESVKVASNQK